MALVLSSDLSPADWIVASKVPWEQLVTFGPADFGAYARLRFLPDPIFEGQQEHEVHLGAARCATDQWRALFELLAAGTHSPDDCCFCLWDGFGFPPAVRQQPKLIVPHGARIPARSYYLFRGPLSDLGAWGAEFASGGSSPYEPALVWPADHAWCVAKDVDPHWAGVGADAPLVEQLVSEPRLDAIAADPTADQPAYR